MKREFVRMSLEADEHVRFVAHILSSMSENAIFAYLGLFLFSSKYEWDAILCSIGVISCIVSRALMVVAASWFIWYMHVFRQRAGCYNPRTDEELESRPSKDLTKKGSNGSSSDDGDDTTLDPLHAPLSRSARALSNYKVQVVLILAGLRGAVSLALVESVPIWNGVTGVGSKNKPLLKAMTSSAIIFTIFVLGGGAYYILKWLDISSDDMLIKSRHKKTTFDASSYYPSLVCGGQNSGYAPKTTDIELPTANLATAPSWRYVGRSPRLGDPLHRSPRASPSPRLGTFVPPSPITSLISQTKSDDGWSVTSGHSAGLNEILERQNSRGVSSVQTDPGGDSTPRRGIDSNPTFPPQIV